MITRLATIVLLSIFTNTLSAQLCQGSLGDPIINITFGAGGNPGAPIAAAATGYQYVPNDCPNDGFYTVRGNSTSCFSNSWHSVTSDHTGDTGGYFMLINASIQPSAFYLDTVRGLCGNSTYEFAAWVLNVIRAESCNGASNQPNLTFRIEKTDGTLLQSYNSGNIPPTASPAWKQYGFFFTTPATIPDIVVRIINNAAGGCGNDLALDDITFRACGPLLTPSIVTQSLPSVGICQGSSQTFNFTCQVSGGFLSPTVQWQQRLGNGVWIDIPGATNLTLIKTFTGAEAPGVYAYRLAVAEAGNITATQCRVVSTPLTITVNANPVTTASNDGPGCVNSSAKLTATGGNTYEWTGPNSFSGTGSPLTINNLQPTRAGKYYVQVINNAGCRKADSTILIVNPSPLATTTFSTMKVCPGDSVRLGAGGGLSYLWQPAVGISSTSDASPNAAPATDTRYAVIVENVYNCADTAYVDIDVITLPRADAGSDKSMLETEPVELTGTVSGENFTFSWEPSPYLNNTGILNPTVNPPVDTKFVLTATSIAGCGMSSDTVNVFVYKKVFIPNAFTPNADGKNDTWFIPALSSFKDFEVYVYNRYGELVFHSRNENRAWDGTYRGKRAPVGVYTYLVDFKRYMAPMKGTVMILR